MKEYARWVFVFVVGLIIGGGLGYCTTGQAITIPGNADKCMALAGDVGYMTQLRDQGVTWEMAEKEFRPQAQTVIGAPDSYIADRQDFEYTMNAFKFGFKSDLNAQQTMRIVYDRCMAQLKTS